MRITFGNCIKRSGEILSRLKKKEKRNLATSALCPIMSITSVWKRFLNQICKSRKIKSPKYLRLVQKIKFVKRVSLQLSKRMSSKTSNFNSYYNRQRNYILKHKITKWAAILKNWRSKFICFKGRSKISPCITNCS